MSPLSRNPRDATIQLRDIQRWGRCRGSLRGRSHGRHVHRPSLDRWLALTGISFGSVLLCPPFRGPGGPLRGYGLVRSRCPDQLLASCPRTRGLRGCGLVRSRCPDQLLASCPRSCRLPRQERSSETGNHGTTPPYGRELPPGRTRKGEIDSDSLFRVFRWIPWLISDPSGAAIGCCWTESAVRICADLGCRDNNRQPLSQVVLPFGPELFHYNDLTGS